MAIDILSIQKHNQQPRYHLDRSPHFVLISDKSCGLYLLKIPTVHSGYPCPSPSSSALDKFLTPAWRTAVHSQLGPFHPTLHAACRVIMHLPSFPNLESPIAPHHSWDEDRSALQSPLLLWPHLLPSFPMLWPSGPSFSA